MNNILIVEDDPMANQFYGLIFSKAGYNTIFSEDSEEIIDFIRNSSVDLAILDINLKNTYFEGKKTDGVKLCSYLKNTVNSEIPVIIVTAYNTGVSFRDILDNSLADDLVIKPISDYNLLLDKVKGFVN